jgi:hypothetical protein
MKNLILIILLSSIVADSTAQEALLRTVEVSGKAEQLLEADAIMAVLLVRADNPEEEPKTLPKPNSNKIQTSAKTDSLRYRVAYARSLFALCAQPVMLTDSLQLRPNGTSAYELHIKTYSDYAILQNYIKRQPNAFMLLGVHASSKLCTDSFSQYLQLEALLAARYNAERAANTLGAHTDQVIAIAQQAYNSAYQTTAPLFNLQLIERLADHTYPAAAAAAAAVVERDARPYNFNDEYLNRIYLKNDESFATFIANKGLLRYEAAVTVTYSLK